MDTLRVVVVDDSLTVRRHLTGALESQPGFQVVGEAADGREAIALVRDLRPDVVTMDMMLPVMSGLAATEYIMAHHPTPILVVSASTNRGELFHTYDALAAGAVDVLEKPGPENPGEGWAREFAERVRTVARVRVITHPAGKLRPRYGPAGWQPPARGKGVRSLLPERPKGCCAQKTPDPFTPPLRAVALGASTGGPAAVLEVLRGLAPDFDLPVLLVLHLAESFGGAFAEWLDGLVPMPVRHAAHGEPLPEPGICQVLMAPPGRHLLLQDGRLHLSDAPERHSCRPSVDVLFESLATGLGPAVAACLLTGMGRDGAQGLQALRQAGAVTVAQDRETSVIWGMPGEAVKRGAAQRVLPLGDIAPALSRMAREGERSRGTRS